MHIPHLACGARIGAISMLTLLVGLGGCAGRPKVSYRYDSKTDFAAFKTYVIEPSKSPSLNMRMLDGKPAEQTIAEAIERQLDARGLRQVAAAPADLVVRWRAELQEEQASSNLAAPSVDLNGSTTDFVLDSGPPGTRMMMEESIQGGILIDLISAKSNHTVWRGGVGGIIDRETPDPERVARLNKELAILFANYPPPKSGAAQ